jgi:hypothetical protein
VRSEAKDHRWDAKRPELPLRVRALSPMSGRTSFRTEWEVWSLAGPAGWGTTRELARIRRAEGTYDPTRLAEA